MDESQVQNQIVQLVLAAMAGDQKATLYIQQVMQAAQLGDLQAVLLAQMILAVAQQMLQQQVQAAKFGAKLNYLRQLKGKCPEGYEMEYYKDGGRLCKRCTQVKLDGGEMEAPKNPIDAFKCGRKMKKIKKGQQGLKQDLLSNSDNNPKIGIASNYILKIAALNKAKQGPSIK